jgi:hypothetical protein
MILIYRNRKQTILFHCRQAILIHGKQASKPLLFPLGILFGAPRTPLTLRIKTVSSPHTVGADDYDCGHDESVCDMTDNHLTYS